MRLLIAALLLALAAPAFAFWHGVQPVIGGNTPTYYIYGF